MKPDEKINETAKRNSRLLTLSLLLILVLEMIYLFAFKNHSIKYELYQTSVTENIQMISEDEMNT